MKYLSVLLVFCLILSAGTINAQSTTSAGGKSYTYMLSKSDGSGEQSIDKMVINGNSISSEKFSSTGFKSGTVIQKTSDATTSQFEATLQKGAKASVKYDLTINGPHIYGNAIITNDDGTQTSMMIRGMTTEEWDKMQK